MDELFCSMLCVSSSLLSRFQHVCPMTGPGIQDARVVSCPSATANRTRDGRFMELWEVKEQYNMVESSPTLALPIVETYYFTFDPDSTSTENDL
jgi:hypothetical protein